ncbi:MAG: carbonic anhydrase [Bdellovibrionales bacterium]
MIVRITLSSLLLCASGTVFALDAGHVHPHATGVAPEQSTQWLTNGNKRFTTGKFRKDGRSLADIKKLETGQKPHAIVLSCSDSRVPPEHVFDQAFGEIFVIRVAGEALDTSVLASIEYAVEHLGTRNIVVMGHTQCGAVKAAMSAKIGKTNGSPSLDALVGDIKPRLPASVASSDVAAESGQNAKGVAADLLKRSKIISAKVADGTVQIHPALYHLNGGKVEWLTE